jgi:polysaccharide pyruvyl transferase WcaK-like protein
MKLLHVASFVGNVGDNASHRGLGRLLGSLGLQPEWTRLEMRRFYRNARPADRLRFDASFVEQANQHDLLIVGGGGFLDYWVPDSASGTTLDMAPELLAQLRVPTLITSVGCAPHKPVPPGNVQRFRRFLDAALANPCIRIAVRNDGSVDAIRRDIGAHYLERIPQVLDHGFFYADARTPDFLPEGPFVAMNIADDQVRMNSTLRGAIDEERYFDQLAATCAHITGARDLPLVLVPHIPADLMAIARLLARMDDLTVRQRVSVAPCIQGEGGADRLFGVYAAARLVLATRLHANICSLAMQRRTVGMVALDRVQFVYDQLGLSDDAVLLAGYFSGPLIRRTDRALDDVAPALSLDAPRAASRALYRGWLQDLGLVR